MLKYTLLLFNICSVGTSTPECELVHTEVVICTGQGFSNIPDFFNETITTLVLSENNITTLDSRILVRYKNLENLRLNFNCMQTPADYQSISLLPKLTSFDISNNCLAILDFSKFHFNRLLENVTANNNFRLKIYEYSEELPALKIVSLRNCKIDYLPLEAFEGFLALQVLDLKDNLLKVLPDGMAATLPKLRVLHIFNNPLLKLDSAIRLKSDLVDTNFYTETQTSLEYGRTGTNTRSVISQTTELYMFKETTVKHVTTKIPVINNSTGTVVENGVGGLFKVCIIILVLVLYFPIRDCIVKCKKINSNNIINNSTTNETVSLNAIQINSPTRQEETEQETCL